MPKAVSHPVLILLGVAFAAVAVWLWHVPVNHDSAYLMLVAERYLDGEHFYFDQNMANPPLAPWLHAAVVLADKTMEDFGIGPFGIQLIMPFVLLMIGISVTLSAQVLAVESQISPHQRDALLVAAFAALTLAPLHDFGQRDHLFAVFTFAYVLLAGVRFGGGSVGYVLAGSIGAFAFFGVALKPHFVLLPVALEAMLLWRTKRFSHIFRTETLILSVLLTSYALSVVIWYPEYFTTVLPRYVNVFYAFTMPLSSLVLLPETILALVAVAVLLLKGTRETHSTIIAVTVATVTTTVIFFLQKKGWSYQRAPIMVFATWTFAAMALTSTQNVFATARRWAVVGVGLVVLLVALRGPYVNVYTDTVGKALAEEGSGGSVYVFTSNVSVPYPTLLYEGVTPASRFNTLWMIPGLIRSQASGDVTLAGIEQFARDAILDDFQRRKPRAVGVDVRNPKPYFNGVAFDYLNWALEDPRFREEWKSYQFARKAYDFDIYVRKP